MSQKKIVSDQTAQWASPVADSSALKSKLELEELVEGLKHCSTAAQLAELTATLTSAFAMLKQLRESAKKSGHRNGPISKSAMNDRLT